MTPDPSERERIAAGLGIGRCPYCSAFCPYCPRLLAARPDLAPTPPPTPPPSVAPREFRRDRLLMAAARTCPYRDPCGCAKATCHARRGPSPVTPGEVYLGDCVSCLKATWGLDAPE